MSIIAADRKNLIHQRFWFVRASWLVFALLLSTMINVVWSQEFFVTITNGYITINGLNSPYIGTATINIPENLYGWPVTNIRSNAFRNKSFITSVTISKSVTNIGPGAFSRCSRLLTITVDPLNSAYCSVDGVLFDKTTNTLIQCPGGKAGSFAIPNSVTNIADFAFFECARLTSVTIPNSVVSMGRSAFRRCSSLTNVAIGSGVTSIGSFAFSSCTNLTSVTIGNGVTSIGDAAFYYCTNLTSVTIPTGVTNISDNAFFCCASLANATIPNSVTKIGDWAFCRCFSLSSLIMPDSVISIGSFAFSECSSVTDVTIFNGIASIGNGAFSSCTSLPSVTIPASVSSIGEAAFSACDGLSEIAVDDSNPFYCSVDGVLFDKSTNTLIQCPGGKGGSYTIPNSVTNILDCAFSSCSSLTSVTIPANVSSIGNDAFSGCDSLSEIAVDDPNPSYCSVDGVLFDKGTNTLIQCPEGKVGSYSIPNSVTNIGSSTFAYCSSLTSVAIGNGVTTIGQIAFAFCTSLTNVTIPDSVTTIGMAAFNYCLNLTDITIPNSVSSIGSGAFSFCRSLTNVTIPNSVTSIGDSAFFSCANLTSATIGNGVTNVGYSTFYYCTSLRNVTIGSGVTSIASYAFQHCTNLSGITVDAFNSAFSSVDGVLFDKVQTTLIKCPEGKTGNYALPNGVTTISDSAFDSCRSLYSVTFPASVRNIGNSAFSFCTGLTAVTIGSGVTNIGAFAFWSLPDLTGVYFQGDAPLNGSSGFAFNNKATYYHLPGTTGWGATFAGRPTALWKPQVQTGDVSFGVQTNQFGFNINWASGQVVVVEACVDLAEPVWFPLQTNTLVGGSIYFSDPDWTNFPARLYRIRSP